MVVIITGCHSVRFQRGYRIGGIFKSLARYALFKQSAKIVGRRALQAATDIGQDVFDGDNVSKAIKSRGKEALKDFAERGARIYCDNQGGGARDEDTRVVLYHLTKSKNCVSI